MTRATARDRRLTVAWLSGPASLLVAGCGGPASTLDPRGAGAAQISSLTWVLIAVAGVIYLLVLGALTVAIRRRRDPAGGRDRWARIGVVAGGGVLPLLVLPALFVVSVRALAALTRPEPPALVVEVTGQQYWWALRYRTPDGRELAIAANELHLPERRRVELRLASVDVIHSFWVPALQGKLDLVPGKTNVTWVSADAPGVYPGHCAEYCGIQHALMRLLVVVQRPDEFEAWLAAQRAPAQPPADSAHAQALFVRHCAHCHTIRGTSAFFGHIGPDLTHLMSRRTLAAGTLPNVKGNLAGWLADPQHHKPGSGMPRITLPPADFHAVVDYLTSLR